MEMIWRGSSNLKELSDIFAGVLYTGYGPPGGFCFDQKCGDDPIQVQKTCIIMITVYTVFDLK